MNSNIELKQKVVILADGIELWMTEEKADRLVAVLQNLNFDDNVNWEGRNFTKSMYRGTFLPSDIEDQKRRKNGQWLCKGSRWHDKFDKCQCSSVEAKTRTEAREAIIAACEKCNTSGLVEVSVNGNIAMRYCDCWEEYQGA